ncbi:ankyrin repeat and SAM domain-containing protein 6-like [Ochlerotatus camptorhynchus]|uniref:ankyrin repeat and SAM domain-containing protein 6-like n=1 Tax=Ochlerotatus camptorhynchus TaxID=644619 RepID=UPI0031DB77EB
MYESRASASVSACAPSPKISVFSPEALDAQDISFEAYKQAKCSNTRKRSFSPMRNMRSPDISPIAMTVVDTTFRIPPRVNTPEAKLDKRLTDEARRHPIKSFFSSTKQPAPDKRKPVYAIGTPLVKRELEHRLSVSNILRDLNLAKYIGIFNDEEIDFEVFLTLSEKDLHDIGIDCQQDIELILGKVAEYNMNSGGIDF